MRYLAPRWQYRNDQEAGAYEAWYTMHKRLMNLERGLKERERELNVGPRFLFGRRRGYGVIPKPRICNRIRKEKLRPKLNAAGRWDGATAIRPDGTEIHLTESAASQMGVLGRKGAWPDLYRPEKRGNKHARRNLRES
jgi:hypothetical protein